MEWFLQAYFGLSVGFHLSELTVRRKTSGDQMLQYPPSQMMMDQSRWKPHVEIAPNCPRCASPNTKFCYYNNYSLSQPRYFCKGCKRYWTKGGSLRNVPVGGGCRKNRRSRPARLAEANRVGLSYLRDLSSPTRSSNGSVNMSTGLSDGPADIDLADVFAKFLTNQNSEEKPFGDQDSSSGTSCGSLKMAPGTFDVGTPQMENFMMECQIPSHLIQEACLSNELPGDFVGEEDIQEFVCHYPNLNELQELLNDEELPQHISWNDDNNVSSFSWQQGFGQASYNDQVQMATNLVTDDWSSMDLSSYGVFSRP